MRKCPLTRAEEEEQQGGGDGFSFGHFSNVWYYLSTHSVPEEMSKLPKVTQPGWFALLFIVYVVISGTVRFCHTLFTEDGSRLTAETYDISLLASVAVRTLLFG